MCVQQLRRRGRESDGESDREREEGNSPYGIGAQETTLAKMKILAMGVVKGAYLRDIMHRSHLTTSSPSPASWASLDGRSGGGRAHLVISSARSMLPPALDQCRHGASRAAPVGRGFAKCQKLRHTRGPPFSLTFYSPNKGLFSLPLEHSVCKHPRPFSSAGISTKANN